MDRLAGYSSDTESEQFDKSSPFRTKTEHSTNSTKDIDLAAEWESFEKLIAGNGDKDDGKGSVPLPVGVPSPVTAPSSSLDDGAAFSVENGSEGREYEPKTAEDSSPKDHNRKRSFQSDTSESGSELESDDSSDESSDSSEESSASDEPQRKKPRHKSKSKTRESSSSEEESDEESSEEGTDESDDISPDEDDKQKKSSTDEESVPSRTKDEAKKSLDTKSLKTSRGLSVKHTESHSRRRRSRSHDRHKRSYYDRKKHDHSRPRKHRRHHLRHRSHRSRSRDRRHRSRSRTRSHRHRRSRSVDKRKRLSRHHSRSRSRDRHERSRRHSRDRHQQRRSSPYVKSTHRKPLTYKEVLRQKLIEAQHQAAEGKLEFDPSRGKDLMSTNEKPSPLPLMSINPLMSLATGPPGGEKVTPQQALMQTMAAMHQKAQELTGVAVPKYYNPAAVNPLKFAEQVKKRKLLWSKKDTKAEAEAAEAAHQAALDKAAKEGEHSGSKSGSSQWKSTAFLEDKDGRMAAKFRKLMGIKDPDTSGPNADEATEETIKKQQELFNQLDREYQFARMTTHTHRGIGLGFTSQMYPDLK